MAREAGRSLRRYLGSALPASFNPAMGGNPCDNNLNEKSLGAEREFAGRYDAGS